jgi:NADH:ubiquinone reductase (H+-translocating)
LRIPGAPNAFAIGDVATPDAGEQLPMVSPPAMQAGRYVARTIIDEVRYHREQAHPFHSIDKGTMATIGRRAGIAQLPGGIQLTGFIGWLTWLVVHVYYLVGFRNRIVAIAAWAWDYVRFDRPIRIILRAAADPEPP